MRSDLDLSHRTNLVAAETLRKQNDKIDLYKKVLDQVVAERNIAIVRVAEWKCFAERLQAQFAMLEQKGSIH